MEKSKIGTSISGYDIKSEMKWENLFLLKNIFHYFHFLQRIFSLDIEPGFLGLHLHEFQFNVKPVINLDNFTGPVGPPNHQKLGLSHSA